MIRTVGELIHELEKFPKDVLVYIDRFETKYSLSSNWNVENVVMDEIKVNNNSIPFVKITLTDSLEQILSECKCENMQFVKGMLM